MSLCLDINHLPITIVGDYSDSEKCNTLCTDDKQDDCGDSNNEDERNTADKRKQQSGRQPRKHERFVWQASVDSCVCESQITYTNTVHESSIPTSGYTLHDVFVREAYFHPCYRLYPTYRIVDYTDFIESLYYFIAGECLVFPREFETPERIHDETNTIICGLDNHQRHTSVATKVNKAAQINGIAHNDEELGEYDWFCEPILNLRKALLFDKRSGKLSRCSCPDKGALPRQDVDHAHRSSDRFVMFCSEPEIAAALYVNVVTSGRERYRLLSTLKIWLAEVTVNSVDFLLHNSFGRECQQAMIVTELEPAYALHFLYADDHYLLNNTCSDCEEQYDNRRIKRLAVYTVRHNDEFIESCKIYDIHSIPHSEDFDTNVYSTEGKCNDSSSSSSNGSTTNHNNQQQQKQPNEKFTRLLVDHWRQEDVYSVRNKRDDRVLVMRKRQRSRSRSRSGSSSRRRSTSSGGNRSRSRSRSPSASRANKRKFASSGFKASGGGRRRSRSRSRGRSV